MSAEVLRNEARDALGAPLRVRLPKTELDTLLIRTSAVAQQDGVDHQIAELWAAAQASRTGERVSDRGTLPHVLTRRTLAWINAWPELQRAELARKSAACPSELSRYFHRDLGLTLVQYRTRVRVLRFIQLVDSGASLGRSALDAGFGSYSQCHRAFVATLRCSPRAFFGSDVRQRMEGAFEPDSTT